ncbi:MAG: signal peptide peptidase SppA [Pseudomonadota bacterium]
MSRRGWAITIILGIFCLAFLFGFVGCLSAIGVGVNNNFEQGNVALIEVSETLIFPDEIIGRIEQAGSDEAIKAVILRIDSPGGSVAASQEILEAILKLKEKKPVVASMSNVAASGGYYVALGANKIIADAGTITGSIGVRMEHVQISGLLDWAKIKQQTLKSGKYKDIGSPLRELTPEERAILQDMLDDIHNQFKQAVALSRNMPMDQIDKLADGRVFTGLKAKELGLIDDLGGLTRALALAGELGGIEEPVLAKYKNQFDYSELLGIFGEIKSVMAQFKVSAPRLWQANILSVR